MINILTDTLMALWNSTWKGKVLPGLVAFIIVGICMSCFFLLIKLPVFSRQPSVSNHSNRGSEDGIVQSLQSNSAHPTAIATPTLMLTPTQASDSPSPSIPTPMPIQLPGIVSDSGAVPASHTDTGNMNIYPAVATEPVNNVNRALARRHTHPLPNANATSAPSDETIVASTQPATTTIATIMGVPTPTPTIMVAPTPTVFISASNPTPTSTYPATPISGSSPTISATTATNVATISTVAPAVTPTPTANLPDASAIA